MRAIRFVIVMGVVALLACLPFSLPFRFYPDGGFVSGFSALLLVCLLVIFGFASFRQFFVSWFEICLFVFAVLVFFKGRQYGDVSFLVLMSGAFLALVLRTYGELEGRDGVFWALLVGLLLGGSINILSGVVQYFGWEKAWGGLVFSGLSKGVSQVYGNIGQRNIFGEYIAISLLSLFVFFCRFGLSLLVWFLIALLVGLLLAVSGSRSVLLYFALVAGVSVFWYLYWARRDGGGRRALAYLLIAVLAVFIAQVVVSSFHSTGLGRVMGGESARLAEWKKALIILSESFPYGVGWGGYPSHSFLMQLRQDFPGGGDMNWSHSHNIFLNLLVELGVLAILPVGMMFGLGVVLWRSSIKDVRWLFIVLVLGVIFIHSNLEYPLWYVGGFFLLLLLVATVSFRVYSFDLTVWMRGFFSVLGLVAISFMVWSSFGYYKMVLYTYPVNDVLVNFKRVAELNQLAANPVLSYSADLSSLNYMKAGSGEERLCRLIFMNKKMPAVELMDGIILDALILEEEELAFRVARSRYRVFPANSDKGLIDGLEGFNGEYGVSLRARFQALKGERFKLSESYQLEVPKRCQHLQN